MSITELAVLGVLADGDRHGYELKKQLTELPGRGLRASFGSLYPTLAKLEAAGRIAATTDEGSERPAPMSGSLAGEAALFRAKRSRPPRSSRRRKVFAITDLGRQRLTELLLDGVDDDRRFPLQVAFCARLEDQQRRALFHARRDHVAGHLAGRPPTDDHHDQYRQALAERYGDSLTAELAWLDRLIENEPQATHAQGALTS